MNRRQLSRRRFLQGTAAAGGAALVGPYILRGQDSTKKLNIAFVGTGGRGDAHMRLIGPFNCVAYCDVDEGHWGGAAKRAPSAKGYTDYREMFDKHMKEIDAVVVATPDHNHACASMYGIKNGKHVYCEKPLTWSVNEARAIAEATAKSKVATQMGNMGHSGEGIRLCVEWIRDGAIGDVKEVHTWTNRPIWPQGNPKRPAPKPVPAKLNWDAWIGPAAFREYHDGLHGFAWRGWFDFGCGAIGDMGCHTWDNVFWAMQVDYPSTVELIKIVGKSEEMFPKQSISKWTFPEKNGRPGFVGYWYEGGLKPDVKEKCEDVLAENANYKLPDTGSLYIGTKGKFVVGGDYADNPRLVPESFMKAYKRPAKTIARVGDHWNNWTDACYGKTAWDSPGSNFATYAGPLTEVMLLAAIVQRIGEEGFKMECDPVKREILTKQCLALAGREYRKGWSL